MASGTILVNLDRCTGCWTCAMACKVINKLDDDEYRITVKTLGSGEGIDRPAGTYPDLHMTWQPIWNKGCTKCASRVAEGKEPFCVYSCPVSVLKFGNTADEELARLKAKGFSAFELPGYEQSKEGVVYAHSS